ncbi:MAG: hypothetical protein LAT64_00820 [Phycisphaerales bacterium]|nr:hypothetical protein [Planctomycetota bacterium]MCH8507304.1 hypothetical protein [Phycisphaerales bacterium]
MTILDWIEDDRGRRWKPCDIVKASKESGIDRFLIAPPTHRPDVLRAAAGMGVLFAAMMLPVQSAISYLQSGDPAFGIGLILTPIYLIGFGLPMGYLVSQRNWRSTAHARDAMLGFVLCPSCAHGIGRIPPAPDGCVICPECGAAWRAGPTDHSDA